MDLVGVVLSWAKARTRSAGQGQEESVRMGKVGVTAGPCCTQGWSAGGSFRQWERPRTG